MCEDTTRMESNGQPATKQDIAELRTEMRAQAAQLREEFRSDMDRQTDRLVEQMRDMQTEVLRAFPQLGPAARVHRPSHS